ncbi:unnamed protein product [Caenorhabditis brenneri]
MTFPVLSLVDLPLLEVLQHMDTIDKIRFYLSLDNHMKGQLTKYVSLGEIQVLDYGNDATLWLGNMRWSFSKKKHWNLNAPVVEIGLPLAYKALDESYDNTTVWISQVENPRDAVLSVAVWALNMFPRTKRTSFLIDLHSSANVEKLVALNLRKFEEGRVVVDHNCDSATNKYFYEIIKNWDVALVNSAGRNSVKKVAFLKNLKKKEKLPVRRENFSTVVPLLDHHCEYVVLSGLGVQEAHLQNLVDEWMTEKTQNLIFIKVKSIGSLDLSKILPETEQWNDKEMEKFKSIPQFKKYFEEKGAIIRNPNGQIASIHMNKEEGTFTFVAWNTAPYHKTLDLHNDLPLY